MIAAGLATAMALWLSPAQVYEMEKPFPYRFVKLRTAKHSPDLTVLSFRQQKGVLGFFPVFGGGVGKVEENRPKPAQSKPADDFSSLNGRI